MTTTNTTTNATTTPKTKTKKTVTMKDIWTKLSKVDVSKHTKVKNNLSYLAWADAIGIVMEHYPNMTYQFQHWTDANGSVQMTNMIPTDKGWTGLVACSVTIEGHQKQMFLPIMTGFKNSAVLNPTSRDVGDALMRCLVKCLAMFGLGHHLYTGEELPKEYAKEEHVVIKPTITPTTRTNTARIQPVTDSEHVKGGPRV